MNMPPMLWLVGQTWKPHFRLFTWTVICNILISWSSLGDWQLVTLWKSEHVEVLPLEQQSEHVEVLPLQWQSEHVEVLPLEWQSEHVEVLPLEWQSEHVEVLPLKWPECNLQSHLGGVWVILAAYHYDSLQLNTACESAQDTQQDLVTTATPPPATTLTTIAAGSESCAVHTSESSLNILCRTTCAFIQKSALKDFQSFKCFSFYKWPMVTFM